MREATNPLVAVQMVIDDWTRANMGDECFWEDWPECPSECSLTPNMVKAALEANQQAIAELVEALEEGHDLIRGDLVEGHWKRACRKFTTNARALISKHKVCK